MYVCVHIQVCIDLFIVIYTCVYISFYDWCCLFHAMFEITMMITVTTHANVSCLNNYRMTFDAGKIQSEACFIFLSSQSWNLDTRNSWKNEVFTSFLFFSFLLLCSGRRATNCTEKWLEVNSLNYFHDFTQTALCHNITIMNHNISMFYLALASRSEGHIWGKAWVCYTR